MLEKADAAIVIGDPALLLLKSAPIALNALAKSLSTTTGVEWRTLTAFLRLRRLGCCARQPFG